MPCNRSNLPNRSDKQPLFITDINHEATFEDQEIEDARKKRDSTMSEALKIAKGIQASSKLLLIHFSQRYISFKHFGPQLQDLNSILMGLATDELWTLF
jgi:ribonuclease BN (tRNA processing enzyme)